MKPKKNHYNNCKRGFGNENNKNKNKTKTKQKQKDQREEKRQENSKTMTGQAYKVQYTGFYR